MAYSLLKAVVSTAFLINLSGAPRAQDAPRAAVSQLFSEMMSEWPDKQVRSFVVEFLPGGAPVPHTHPGPIFAYVLKGTWVMQMEGMDEETLRPGQVAYEHAGHKHLVSRNASTTEPLQLIVSKVSSSATAL